MKKNYFITMFIFCTVLILGCEKNEKIHPTGCIQVRILDAVCNTAVLQITDPAYYHLGDNGYVKNGVTYDHVFTTVYPCKLPSSDNPGRPNTGVADKPFYVQILEQPEASDPNCVSCMAVVSNAPNKTLYVKFSEKCN